MQKKEYSFVGKRYTTWSDESSGIGGKARKTTYGIYDNKRGTQFYGIDKKIETYEEAKDIAIEMNSLKREKIPLEVFNQLKREKHSAITEQKWPELIFIVGKKYIVFVDSDSYEMLVRITQDSPFNLEIV